MVRTTELRITNLVLDNCGDIYIVQGITSEGIEIDSLDGTDRTEAIEVDLHPIPLTADLLEKCGFKPVEEEYDSQAQRYYPAWKCNTVRIVQIDGAFYLWIAMYDEHYSYRWTKIEILHQLQNLYYSLTGAELTLNLKQ